MIPNSTPKPMISFPPAIEKAPYTQLAIQITHLTHAGVGSGRLLLMDVGPSEMGLVNDAASLLRSKER